jgi:hypothetical protein
VVGGCLEPDYIKYPHDRAPEYSISTRITETEAGERKVRKYPMSEASCDHVRQMYTAYEKLSDRYAGGRLDINVCRLFDSGEEVYAEFDYVKGKPLSEIMDGCLESDDLDEFYRYFNEYIERTGYNSQCPAADFDLIFSNILVDGDKWTLIDYEWTFGRTIDTKELAFRAIYCYLLENEKRDRLDTDRIMEKLQITAAEAENYREQEMDFQKFVTGNRLSMAQIRNLIGCRLNDPRKWMDRYNDYESLNRVQIYEDMGEGCKEEHSYFVKDAYQGENFIEFTLSVSGDVHILRIDPSFYSCMVKINEMTFNSKDVPLEKKKVLLSNGRIIKASEKENAGRPSIVFPTEDPNIYIDLTGLERNAENTMTVKMEIVRLPMEMAKDMAASVKRII